MKIIQKKDLDGRPYIQMEMSEEEFTNVGKAIEEFFNSTSIGTYRRMDVAKMMAEFLKVKQERGM